MVPRLHGNFKEFIIFGPETGQLWRGLPLLKELMLRKEAKMEEKVKLTKEDIEACRTDYGGFTRATIDALGVKRPLEKGWGFRLIGTEITINDLRKAYDGRLILTKLGKKSRRKAGRPY